MMSAVMKAVQYHGKEDIRISTSVPVPSLQPGQVLIAPAFCGICGTDLHEYLGGPNFAPKPDSPHPLTKATLPIGFGHEFSGTIAAIAPDVDGSAYPIGAHCAVQPTLNCALASCGACSRGATNACPRGGFVGLSGGGGGLAERVAITAARVFPLPSTIPLDVGALVEPLSVAWHAVDASGLRETGLQGRTVLILGAGPIGLAVLLCLRAVGVGTVLVSEVAARRQRFARDMGAHRVLDPRDVDIVAACRDATGGDGVDVVFDCAGAEATIRAACTAIRARGTVVNVAIWEGPTRFDPTWLVMREGRYLGVLGYQEKDYRAVIGALADGRIDAGGMITSRIRMEDLVEKGFSALVAEKDRHVKILVDMGMK